MGNALNRYFHLTERGSSLQTEILAGLTTFVTMAYIVVINPAILNAGGTGLPTGPSTVATILTAIFGCLLMGLYANRPIAIAPYMGENAFIAFGLAALGITWNQRIAAVFLGGALLAILTLARARAWLAQAISPSLKHAFAVGIGLFLLFIGLYETGIVTSYVSGMPVDVASAGKPFLPAPDVPVKIGNLRDPAVLLAIGGFILMAVLSYWRVPGALLLAMAATGAGGIMAGLGTAPHAVTAMPFTGEYDLSQIACKMDLTTIWHWSFIPLLLTLFLMSFLDTLGTLVGVGAAGGMLDDKGHFPDIQRPMMVDALSCMFSGLVGTSTSGAYIESATGIREGGRTGLTAIIVALLFALTLFFLPLAQALQQLRFAYGPALIMVGVLMLKSARHIDLEDLTEAVPAVVTIAMMVFTYNIANGLTSGLLLWPVLKLVCGRRRDIPWGGVVLALLCAGYFVFGLPH
jgi:adenine/guanine/hypoxanthine permease